MVDFKANPPYAINNFPSSYTTPVYPGAKTLLHIGEIDVAFHSLARDGVEKVCAVDINPTTTAIGAWKRVALEQLDPDDYATMLYLMGFSRILLPDLKRRVEELKPHSYGIHQEIMKRLQEKERKLIASDIEISRRDPHHRSDNGTLRTLHYLDRIEEVRNRICRLEIFQGDIAEIIPYMRGFDIVSLNNVLDYLPPNEIGELLKQIGYRMNQGGRLIRASQHYFGTETSFNEFVPTQEHIVTDFVLKGENGYTPRGQELFRGRRFILYSGESPAVVRYESMCNQAPVDGHIKVGVYQKVK